MASKWVPQAGQNNGDDPMSIWEEVERPVKKEASDQGGTKATEGKRPSGEPKKPN